MTSILTASGSREFIIDLLQMATSTKIYDVAVIGAGIVGAACAASLSREGLRVVIVESKNVASGATAAGMGHIVVMDDSEAQFALTQYSQALWNELVPELPTLAEFQNCGTIWVAADDEEMKEVRRKHDLYSSRGLNSEILDERSLLNAEPNLREGLGGGLLVGGDSVVYQLFATRYLIETAKQNGSVLRTGRTVVEITDDGAKLDNGEHILSKLIVNAAGFAAADLSPELDIAKRKGHLIITERYPNFVRHQLVELGYLRSAHGTGGESVAFNVQPRGTGQLLIGSSRQFGAEIDEIDHNIVRRMTSRAFEFMSGLRSLSVTRVWTGFRPATPDNLPYIGQLPDSENVYVAAGHEGLGITTSIGTAELITDTILGCETAIPIDPYLPGRRTDKH